MAVWFMRLPLVWEVWSSYLAKTVRLQFNSCAAMALCCGDGPHFTHSLPYPLRYNIAATINCLVSY